MSFQRGRNPFTGEEWMRTGTLDRNMAAPVFDDSNRSAAKQREADQAIEQALAESPVLQTADGLLVEQSATGGYILSSPDSLRHKLAAMNEAEAAAIADYKKRFNVS